MPPLPDANRVRDMHIEPLLRSARVTALVLLLSIPMVGCQSAATADERSPVAPSASVSSDDGGLEPEIEGGHQDPNHTDRAGVDDGEESH